MRQLHTRGDEGIFFFPRAILIKLRKWRYSSCSKYLVDIHTVLSAVQRKHTQKCKPKKQGGLKTGSYLNTMFSYHRILPTEGMRENKEGDSI